MTARPPGPFYDDEVHVLREMCSTCIFRPGNLMHLSSGRVKDMVEKSIEQESAIQCHKTLDHSTEQWSPAICRGYFDLPRVAGMAWRRLGIALGMIREDPPGDA